jgi:hypothetical protein
VTDGKATPTAAAITRPAKAGSGTRREVRAGARPSPRASPSQAGVEPAVLVSATEAEPGRDAVLQLSSPQP